mgnify:CR=1 FL=1
MSSPAAETFPDKTSPPEVDRQIGAGLRRLRRERSLSLVDLAARTHLSIGFLSQIERARRQEREHVYLGFWLDGHPKMDYKKSFAPLEYLDGREWKPVGSTPPGQPGDAL